MAETKTKTFANSLMKGDKILWGIYWWLIGISIIEMYSASSSLAYKAASNSEPIIKHFSFLLAGFGCISLFQSFKPATIRNWGILFYIIGLLLMVLTPVFGRTVNGASRDIFGLQPAELLKVGLMIVLSLYVSVCYHHYNTSTPIKQYRIMLVGIALVCFPIFLQNLSTALIVLTTSFCTMLLGGVSTKYLGRTALVFLIAGAAFMTGLWTLHQCNAGRAKPVDLGILSRANTWESRIFDKEGKNLWEEDINGEKAQELNAHMALANSMMIGRLPGNSQLRDFLPEAYSDYIFAIIFEELGVIGAGFVILLYLALLIRAYVLARRCDDLFQKLVLISLAMLITFQALIHIGVCTGAMFVTGQPLPIISRGGSSILLMSCAFGIMFSITRNIEHTRQQREEAGQREAEQEQQDMITTTDKAI